MNWSDTWWTEIVFILFLFFFSLGGRSFYCCCRFYANSLINFPNCCLHYTWNAINFCSDSWSTLHSLWCCFSIIFLSFFPHITTIFSLLFLAVRYKFLFCFFFLFFCLRNFVIYRADTQTISANYGIFHYLFLFVSNITWTKSTKGTQAFTRNECSVFG